jgi:hypothetical protein
MTDPEIHAHVTWSDTGIPRRLWGYTLREHVAQYPETEFLSRWVTGYRDRHKLDEHGYPVNRTGFGTGIFLYGPPGRGKTTSACAVLTSFAKLYDQSVQFVRWDNFLRMKQALIAGSTPQPDYAYAVSAVENAALVALDDVGQEYSPSDYGPAQFVQLIRSRFDRGLPTIVTTNLSEAEWTRRYDAAGASFIKRACVPMSFSPSSNAG